MHFLDLPECLILQIFSKLSRVELLRISLVCRSWLRIVYDRNLWQVVGVNESCKNPEECIRFLIDKQLSPFVKMLDLTNCIFTPSMGQEINDHFPQLETLIIQNDPGFVISERLISLLIWSH